MAEELLIQKSTLTEIGDAIRAREGSTGDIPVTDLATRILAIKGGVEVKRATGTFTTDYEGNATVECGFKPDLVMFEDGSTIEVGDYVSAAHAAIAFSEQVFEGKDVSYIFVINSILARDLLSGSCRQTENGFSVLSMMKTDIDNAGANEDYYSSTFNYVAVNYTSEGTGSSGVIYPVAEEGAF